ncbi:glycosyltransferase family 9 protein [Winogradskyella maritima]|uniref:Glycosyltransferase family 9 protein n=1 Tax=Winogradskyella maritima TaxID=1517766 RepID=A0ABV8AE12_9FLAO|nr:glycosyltransferase family 9 protein [Winogradskyella maritima]
MPKPTHILVIRLSAMGDAAMSVPVLRALVEKYPDVKVTVLTRGFFKPMFAAIPNVSVYGADLKGKHKGFFGLYKLSKELKTLKFDVVADLHNVLRTKILKLFFGKKVIQIDKGRAEKKALVKGEIFEQLKTTHQRYADVFSKLGFPISLENPAFPEKKGLSEKLQGFIHDDSKSTIGIAPFAAHAGKQYPLSQMKQVISELAKEHNIILFGGGQKEEAILSEIAETAEAISSIVGKLSFEDELQLISHLDLMIAMDSSNGHLAAMQGIKVLSIWGVTHPYAGFAPFNQPLDFALTADRNQFPKIPTSIYGNTYPEGYEDAAGSISVETIIEKVKTILSNSEAV